MAFKTFLPDSAPLNLLTEKNTEGGQSLLISTGFPNAWTVQFIASSRGAICVTARCAGHTRSSVIGDKFGQYAVADGHPAPSGGSPVSEERWVHDEDVASI
jgi:hypothetical protein